MAVQKKDDSRISAKIFGKLSLIVGVLLLLIGFMTWKMGANVISTVNKGIAGEKIYFPPEGTPGFDETTHPNAHEHAGKHVNDGKIAKVFAEEYLGKQIEMIGQGKTGFEVSAMAAADPQNASLQQLQTVMFQMGTSKALLMNAYGGWMQAKVMQNAGMIMLLAGAALLLVACVQFARAKRL